MITLGGIELNRYIQWPDRFTNSNTIAQNRRFLGGNLQILQTSTIKGHSVTLKAAEDQGWLTKTMVDGLRILSDTLETSYILDFEGDVLDVMFDHSDEAAVTMSPLVVKSTYTDEDFFIGSIHLITV